MEKIDLTTADYDTLRTYVIGLRDRIMDKEFIRPIAESLANRNDLTLFQKCSIMDLISEQSEQTFVRYPFLAAPKGTPIQMRGTAGFRFGAEEAKNGTIKNTIPQWCETQKTIFMATVQPLTDKQPTAQQLPDELKTEAAQKYFAKAVELGLMTEGYKWLSGLQVLACFAREMSTRLNLGKGGRISWKPFEMLFDIAPGKLRLNYNDIQKTGQDPRDAHLVDEVFK